jgi:uncharacterized phage-associated protein
LLKIVANQPRSLELRNLQLAYEILKIYEDFNKTEMTLLKLQKLAYYSYAIALAHDYDEELEGIEFEAWKTGAVNRKIHVTFFDARDLHATITATHPEFESIKQLDPKATFSKQLYDVIVAVVHVYSRLSQKELINEIRNETIYKKTVKRQLKVFNQDELKTYFKKKSHLPLNLFNANSYLLDNIPIVSFDILELANYLKNQSQSV